MTPSKREKNETLENVSLKSILKMNLTELSHQNPLSRQLEESPKKVTIPLK
jgi:hypothetical protein